MRLVSLVSLLLPLVVPATSQDTNLTTVKQKFYNAGIPQDTHINFNPSLLLEVTYYPPLSPAVHVSAGVRVYKNATSVEPAFGIRAGSLPEDQKYVIAMIDPDAPTPENRTDAQNRHFLGGNFYPLGPSRDGVYALQELSLPDSIYLPLQPGSEFHRYTFYLFVQPPKYNEEQEVTLLDSFHYKHWDVAKFAKDVGLGDPVGGTFMLVNDA